jgi:Mlc titration factor MtfA (ptsG expression regulator)
VGFFITLLIALFFLLLVLSPFISALLFVTMNPVNAIVDFVRVRRLHRMNSQAHHNFFSERLHYYTLLDEEEKQTFIRRVNLILTRKNFKGESDLEPDEEMKLLFAGTLVKLTFGLFNYELAWHGTIVFFPSLFVFGKSQSMKGLTFFSDKIVFSLPDFLHGIKDPYDKLDVAIHECAHALKANHVRDIMHLFEAETGIIEYHEYSDNRFESRFIAWHNVALREYRSMKENSGTDHFFRAYAATNMDEFWAVSVEHFFEAPLEFREKLPILYQQTAFLLNQDIASRVVRCR